MPKKEVSEAELDKMIDDALLQEKQAGHASKHEPSMKQSKDSPKKESVPKEAKKEPKADGGARETKAKKTPAMKAVEGYNPWETLDYPHLTEKSMNLVERNNVLVFIVKEKADKAKVKEAVEKGFGVRVESVNIEITTKNRKKAYVKLAEGALASDIAARLGMI